MIYIKSKDNEKIKLVKSLQKSKYRSKERKYISEGLRSVELAIEFNADINFVFISNTFYEGNKNIKIISELEKITSVFVVNDSIFDMVSTTENTQGIMAIIDMKDTSITSFNLSKHKKIVVLDRVQDPGNVGTIIRTADAAGFDLVILTKGCVDIYNPKVVRSTMGSLFYMDVIISDENSILKILKDNYFQVVSSYLNTDNFFDKVEYEEAVALVVGNEANGINNFWIENSDLLVKIPLYGKAESLNVAISSAILMYKIKL